MMYREEEDSWKLSQVFGERCPGEELQDVDIVTAIEFDKSGDYLAVGDRGGRIIIFETKNGKNTPNPHFYRDELEQMDYTSTKHPEYQYKTEFQSHEPEVIFFFFFVKFDYLKSLEIEEKINRIRWCSTPNESVFILSTNDKTIKLWKVKDRKVKKVKEMNPSPYVSSENTLLAERSFMSGQETPSFSNGYQLEWTEKVAKNMSPSQEVQTKIANNGDAAHARCRKVYGHAHDFNINSISNNSDGETFISADDLRINLWNLEISDQCFNIVDMKPSNMDDLTGLSKQPFKNRVNGLKSTHIPLPTLLSSEVITSAEFHPVHCNLLAYSSSRGFIRLIDMRQSALCDHNIRMSVVAHSCVSFSGLCNVFSDLKNAFCLCMLVLNPHDTFLLWDMRMDSTPVTTFKIHEHLRPKLCDLYNNDSIFDKFGCCVSGNGLDFATGSYSNLLRIFSHGVGSAEGITIEGSKIRNRKPLPQAAPLRSRRSSLSNLTRGFYRQGHENSRSGSNDFCSDFKSKLLHLVWHPRTDLIACASGNSLFLYHA
ncbi:hypothetical protein EZV62_022767 [Acer yangbiense]|uniref:Serine/threonine-protein phosphatase 2A 55 kDa regulatory subunit B n=1 Tax=Acer yangbiense TaxID=1000413 RepID=A0A5C7H000_9ROSI|nr:hypothetical protein EZV62_022767 [Acer yangbiense]